MVVEGKASGLASSKSATIFNEWLDLYYEVDASDSMSLVHRDKQIPEAKVLLK